MSHLPRKPTQFLRCTAVQELRTILPPELSAPEGSYRKVQLLVPDSPKVYAALDVVPADDSPEAEEGLPVIGMNRTYKLPVMAPGQTIRFSLLPHQFLVVASDTSFAEVSLIVEYRGGE